MDRRTFLKYASTGVSAVAASSLVSKPSLANQVLHGRAVILSLAILRSEARMGRLLLIPLPLLLAGYVLLSAYQTEPVGVSPALAAVLTAQPTTRGCDAPPALSYTIPTVIAGPNSQANVNCLAWQDFIA